MVQWVVEFRVAALACKWEIKLCKDNASDMYAWGEQIVYGVNGRVCAWVLQATGQASERNKWALGSLKT